MNENAKKWVAALKSGEFTQCKEELGGPEIGFCCLGVGAAIYEKETGKTLPKKGKGSITPNAYDGGDLDGDFRVVRDWLGLKTDIGSFRRSVIYYTESGTGSAVNLAGLNDSARWDFQQIAGFIEAEPEGLFVTEEVQENE